MWITNIYFHYNKTVEQQTVKSNKMITVNWNNSDAATNSSRCKKELNKNNQCHTWVMPYLSLVVIECSPTNTVIIFWTFQQVEHEMENEK